MILFGNLCLVKLVKFILTVFFGLCATDYLKSVNKDYYNGIQLQTVIPIYNIIQTQWFSFVLKTGFLK